MADRPDFTDTAEEKAIRSRKPYVFPTGRYRPTSTSYSRRLKRIRCCFTAGRARSKDYFRTTLSYPDTIRLDMGLTYDRIFAPIVNTVLESFTAPEQRTRAGAIRQQMAVCEINMLVTRDLSENTCANRLTANRYRGINVTRDAFNCGYMKFCSYEPRVDTYGRICHILLSYLYLEIPLGF